MFRKTVLLLTGCLVAAGCATVQQGAGRGLAPVKQLLAFAAQDRSDPELAWGALDLALRDNTTSTSDREKALAMLRKLAQDHPQQERYRVRAIVHHLRWPRQYRQKAGALAQDAGAWDNALFDYALAACHLEREEQDEAARDMTTGNRRSALRTYERDVLRAALRSLEEIGYTPFAARMASFFLPETPHMRWMEALGVYYQTKADDEILAGRFEDATAMLGATVTLSEQMRADAVLITTEMDCIKTGRPALEKIRNIGTMTSNYVQREKAEAALTDLVARRAHLADLLVARNIALQPDRSSGKTEAQWVAFFDQVLEKGEAEAVSADPFVLSFMPTGEYARPVPVPPEARQSQ